MQPGAICHVEIMSTDLERSQQFYGALFGWTFQPMGPQYALFKAPGEVSGGFEKVESVPGGKTTIAYILVDDVDAKIAEAVALGATQVIGKSPIPGHGYFGIITDLDGNGLGLFQGGAP